MNDYAKPAIYRVGSMSRRPRICVVSTTPLLVHFFLRPHLAALAEAGDVTLAVNLENDRFTPSLNLPVRIVPIGIKRELSPLADLAALWQLLGLFRRERFDLVWAVAPKAGLLTMLAGWLARLPVRVFLFQGEVWASRRGLWRKLLKAADRLTAASATHLLAVSASERDFLEKEGIVPRGRLGVLGAGSIAGVDLDRFRPDPAARKAARAELGIPEQATLLLFMGRLRVDKGVRELAEAFARMAAGRPELWLLMVGPDEERVGPDLAALMGECSARARVLGFTSAPERYMAAADFICLPSHREGFGMVVIEAAATGIPAIGSRIYGVSDAIVDGGTGILFDVRDVGQLAGAIGRFADDAALRLSQGRAARERVIRDFDQALVVRHYVDFLLRLAGAEQGVEP